MADVQEYKCPCCNGGLEFDPNAQKMKCPFCGTEFDVDAVTAYKEDMEADTADDLNWSKSAGREWDENETKGMKVYKCQSCNGEVIADETQGATACPYCGNPVVMKEQFAGDLKPDYVIPFKLDKNAAQERFKSHLKGKKLLPKVFKDQATIDEIKGVYVPYWLFNADATAHLRYKGTKVRVWSDTKFDYTETQFYSVVRGGNLSFDHVPVDGSSKMDDTLMESLEPFNFKDAVDFKTAYLSGYLADKYDVNAEASEARANERIKNSTVDAFRSTVTNYATVTPEYSSVQLKNGSYKYALYPVWVMNVTWNNEHYMFAMNGQTGKFVGDLPCDKGLLTTYLFKATGICAAICFAALSAFGYFM